MGTEAERERLPTGLLWGVKRSFLEYLSRLPDAGYAVGGGAVLGADGRLLFPTASLADYDVEAGAGVLRFGGTVHFSGHFGFLSLRLSDPWVTIGRDAATLSVADAGQSEGSEGRRAVVDLEPRPWVTHAGARLYAPMPATLRAEGVTLFNDVYEVGEPFDRVGIRIDVEDGFSTDAPRTHAG